MIQAVLLFLVVIVLLGMLGKWRKPRVPPPSQDPAIKSALRCKTCGDYVVHERPAACGRPDCPHS